MSFRGAGTGPWDLSAGYRHTTAGGAAVTNGGPHGAGCYPVLEALGIADRVSPATRSEIALHVVQAASYREAAAMLARRGLACDVSPLVRISTATAETSRRLRDAALAAARSLPVPPMVPWQGSGSASASMAGGCAPAAGAAAAKRRRDATALRHHGVSHACA